MKNGGEDDVMAHEGEQQLVLDNEGGEELRVSEDIVHADSVCQSSKRKSLRETLKWSLQKRVEGEGSSAATKMELN